MRADWNITGSGECAILSESGSMRCRLTNAVLMLWNGNNNLANSEIVADLKLTANSSSPIGCFILRSDENGSNCYRMRQNGVRTVSIERVVNGVATVLGSTTSTQQGTTWVRTRFRVDQFQLSVEEYLSGSWVLLLFVTDTQQSRSAGYSGISSLSTSGFGAWFDNISIGVAS